MASYTDICFAWPVLADGEEEWRRFLQALEGSRSEEYERMRRRLRIGSTRVWFQRARRCGIAVTFMEVDDPAAACSALAASDEPFDRRFKSKLEEFFGVDVTRPRPEAIAELIFCSDP